MAAFQGQWVTMSPYLKRPEVKLRASVLPFPKGADNNLSIVTLNDYRSSKPKSGGNARARDLAAILRQLNGTVPFQERSDLASFVNWKGNAAAPIHRWLRYREAYSPHLITKLALGDKILDPFCGCGSILIGCAERG